MSGGPEALPGMTLGGYRICGRVGRGAMADVYEAEDSTGHRVALKVFRAGAGMSFTMIERFRREAEATKKLRSHPYILTVYATGNEGDYHYIAMERVPDSRSLDSLIHQRIPIDQALNIGIKVAAALQYAHDHQIIHRDVKPANILLDEFQEPMLTDFGVAELQDWPTLTLSGTLTGTPMYMAPEQARGEEVTPASDIYSLAVVLYEAITGKMPYELPGTPSTPAILDAVKHQEPPSARKADRRVSRDLNYVLGRALRKNPSERHASAREFAHDLESVLEGRPITARWVSPWTVAGYWIRRNRTPLAAFLALGLFGAAVWGGVRERLRESTYRELIQIALRTSSELKLARQSTTNPTEPVMRSARQAMSAGRWLEARELLQTAAEVNRGLELMNPLTEAELDLARAETMLHNSIRALELYQRIWEREESATLMRQIAAFEGMLLLILDGRGEEARRVRDAMSALQTGPYVQLMSQALGEPQSEEEWDETVAGWQSRLQWNAEIAEVIRHRRRVERSILLRRLDDLVEQGESPYAWPLPLANYLKGRI